jgi:hypothetical protein
VLEYVSHTHSLLIEKGDGREEGESLKNMK